MMILRSSRLAVRPQVKLALGILGLGERRHHREGPTRPIPTIRFRKNRTRLKNPALIVEEAPFSTTRR